MKISSYNSMLLLAVTLLVVLHTTKECVNVSRYKRQITLAVDKSLDTRQLILDIRCQVSREDHIRVKHTLSNHELKSESYHLMFKDHRGEKKRKKKES